MKYPQMIAISLLSVSVAGMAATAPKFSLTSPQIDHGHIRNEQLQSAAYGFGCKGNNLSPALTWQGAPAGTKSFAVKIFDRDAPTGQGWVHWMVVNIPGGSDSLATGITNDNKGLPAPAIQTRTDFGVPGYGGPCPPVGQTHRYVITLTALNVATLPHITADATPAMVGFMTKANALGTARLDFTQGR